MYRVLLAVDQNEARAQGSAEAVVELPGTENIQVTLVHSFTDNPEGASASQVESVRIARDRLREAGISVEIDETSGAPEEVLPQVAADIDADLIVLAGRKRSPAGKALFGSVTQSLILNSDRSILVASASTTE
jgi:nucleotide-binding universal stress UspA family protein